MCCGWHLALRSFAHLIGSCSPTAASAPESSTVATVTVTFFLLSVTSPHLSPISLARPVGKDSCHLYLLPCLPATGDHLDTVATEGHRRGPTSRSTTHSQKQLPFPAAIAKFIGSSPPPQHLLLPVCINPSYTPKT